MLCESTEFPRWSTIETHQFPLHRWFQTQILLPPHWNGYTKLSHVALDCLFKKVDSTCRSNVWWKRKNLTTQSIHSLSLALCCNPSSPDGTRENVSRCKFICVCVTRSGFIFWFPFLAQVFTFLSDRLFLYRSVGIKLSCLHVSNIFVRLTTERKLDFTVRLRSTGHRPRQWAVSAPKFTFPFSGSIGDWLRSCHLDWFHFQSNWHRTIGERSPSPLRSYRCTRYYRHTSQSARPQTTNDKTFSKAKSIGISLSTSALLSSTRTFSSNLQKPSGSFNWFPIGHLTFHWKSSSGSQVKSSCRRQLSGLCVPPLIDVFVPVDRRAKLLVAALLLIHFVASQLCRHELGRRLFCCPLQKWAGLNSLTPHGPDSYDFASFRYPQRRSQSTYTISLINNTHTQGYF